MNDPAMSWVKAARRGDEEAAAHLVNHFQARLYAFLRRLSGSESDAVELTQRTFCRAWSTLAGFQGRASVASWFHGIAYRVYVDWRRSGNRYEPRSDAWWSQVPDRRSAPDLLTADADAAASTYAAVDHLEPDLRDAIHLHYYQGLSLEDTAEALGVSVSTVKNRAREALAHLQKALGEPPPSQQVTVQPSPGA